MVIRLVKLAMHPLEKTYHHVTRWRDQLVTVKAADAFQPPEHLPRLSVGEIDETEAEHLLEGTLLYHFFEHAKELCDVLVFLFSYCVKHNILPDFIDAWSRANGQGAKSPVYDQLREKALNLNEGNIEHNVQDFLLYVVSLSRHLPQVFDIVQVMDVVIKKNSANRDVRYYTGYGSDGKLLTPEQLVAKYHHVEKMLKFLRKKYRATLEPWMHEPYADLIEDFENSDAAMEILKQRLAQADQRLVAELQPRLRQPAVSGSVAGDARLMYALTQAGGVLLSPTFSA